MIATAGRVGLTAHTSFESCADLRDEWDRLAAETEATVCLTYDHCAAWWAHYGAGRSLEVLAFRDDAGALVGVLPMFVGRVWLGPAWLRLAGLVGSDSTLVVQHLPVKADYAREVFSATLARLLGEGRCDAARFGPLADEPAHVDALRDAARELETESTVVRDAVVAPYTVFELPDTFDDYLALLSKNHRGNYRRGIKALRAEKLLADVVDRPDQLGPEFDRFKRLHDAQWRAEGKLGHFGDWPRSESYHRDLVARHGGHGRAHLVRLRLGDEPISYQLCYSVGSSLHWFLPARVLREDLERHSLGRIGLVQMIEFAIGAGFRRIEGGIGRYDYKVQLGGTERQARSIVVAAPGTTRRLRLSTFSHLSDALHVAYYKAWFQRVAPRVPLPRGPLWTTWIRSRL